MDRNCSRAGRHPDSLFPRAASGEAVSARSPELFDYLARCPLFGKVQHYVVHNAGNPAAYFLLARVGTQVRWTDYGPNQMDRQTALQLALAAQHMAREQFRGSYDLAAATTEDAVSDGWRAAGLRPAGQETIRVRKLAGALAGIERYRMTLLDWDAVCL